VSEQGDETSLESLKCHSPKALALPALIYLLNSQPSICISCSINSAADTSSHSALNLPVILGLQLGINLVLMETLCRADWTPNQEWTERMRQITDVSRYWLVDGIKIGAEGTNTRGWEGSGDWNENVWLGYLVAKEFISSA